MLTLSVHRQDGQLLNPKEESTVLFYDESVRVRLEAPRVCSAHLYVTVLGNFKDREREHSIVIYDEDLSPGKKWDTEIHIRHPRSPLLNPRLEIVATMNYASEENSDYSDKELDTAPSAKYLTPFVPYSSSRSSFLVPFDEGNSSSGGSSDKELAGESNKGESQDASKSNHARSFSRSSGIDFSKPYDAHRKNSTVELFSSTEPAPSVEKAPEEDEANPQGRIEVIRWKAPLVQALELEIRSLRPALERDRVIAEVDLVSGSHSVQVNVCDVELEGGLADMMGKLNLPIVLQPHEKYALCYNLQLRAAAQLASMPASRKPLNLALQCEVLLSTDQKYSTSNPKISTTWFPIVDFEGTMGPLPKTPALNFHSNSPKAPSFSNSNPGGSSTTLDLVSGPRQNSSSNLTLMGGISIIVTGPQFVKVGDIFDWNFKIINRSQRHRLFTITFGSIVRDPSRKDLGLPADPLVSISSYNAEWLRRRAVTHYRNTGANRGIIPLCQELRVGNLAPHVCFETKIQLHALSKGTHTVEAARIEDLTSRDSYDVGSLLDVIVLPREDESA